MDNQPQINEAHSEPLDRREARQTAPGRGNAWIVGLILILLGVAFLMQNMGAFILPLSNWWALFILIPTVGAFDRAWRIYRDAGNRLTASARSALFGGLVLTLITALFLFNLNWAIFGPVLIILAGTGLLVNTLLPEKEQ